VGKTLEALIGENANLVRQVLFQLEHLAGFDGLVPFVFFSALASADLNVDDGALDARRAIQGSVANVAGLFAEDRTQQLFFRGQGGFALRRSFTDQDVAWLDYRADADHAAFVQVAKERFADVRDVARDLFRAELGITRLDFILLDVNRGVVI